jgi:hypothetical protein
VPELTDQELADLQARAEAGNSAAAALEERTTALDAATQATAAATTALLDTTRAANPAIPADLIAGDNPADIAASVERGRALVEQVRAANPVTGTPTNIPTGSPPRTPTNDPPPGVKGIARIAHALTHPGPGSTEV